MLNFHHRGPFHKEIPFWIRWFILDKLRRFLCMKLPYSNMRAQPRANNSLLRRLSLKLTIDNLQEELMQDMGLEHRRNNNATQQSRHSFRRNNRASGQMANHHDYDGSNGESLPLRTMSNHHTSSVHHQLQNLSSNLASPECTAPVTATAPPVIGRSQLHEEVLKTLQVLISRQELDDECEEIANEWRQVAQVIDRLLFWVFLLATVLITLLLLIIIPLLRHAAETDQLDEKLFGLERLDT